MKNSYYITTPIYYVNDKPHIGHAYTTIASDVLARFYRFLGKNVKFLTGTDEHGQKVDKAAKNKNIDPQEFVDEISKTFQRLVKKKSSENLLNISNTDFIRTTEARHKKAAQQFWQKIKNNNYIYKDSYDGWYSVRDEAYYQEKELVDGKAPTGAEVEWVKEESYFFKLSKFKDKLLEFYKKNPEFIQPKSRYNEVVSFVKDGLRDLSISRTTFDWGVKVPDDKKHVMYVWIDALANYLTSAGFQDDKKEFQNFWEESKVIHVVGKDILRFHAIYWPAFLMAAEIELPTQIIAHGWWTIEGEKMSKSIGNVISPDDLIEKYGVDQTRYFLMREISFGNDGDFSKDAMKARINADLANNIGNLVQRTLKMVNKNFAGKVPNHTEFDKEKDHPLMIAAYSLFLQEKKLEKLIEKFAFSRVLEEIIKVSSLANEYIEKQAPWKLKESKKRMGTVLYVLLEVIRVIAISLQPFIPDSADNILRQLNVAEDRREFKFANADYALKQGNDLGEVQAVFPRIE